MKNGTLRQLAVRRGRATPSLSRLAARLTEGALPGTKLPSYPDVETALQTLAPSVPMYCYYPKALEENAAAFLRGFPGHAHYAVKANPDPYVLTRLFAAGIRHFDVASLGEVELVRGLLPEASLAFLHPVKAREAIRAAYEKYNVRSYVLDTMDELVKIRQETNDASDLTILVRLAMPKGSANVPLSNKFGAPRELAIELIRHLMQEGKSKIGISFHVGSQSTDPQSFVDALRLTDAILKETGVALDVLDVGGGFPIEGLNMDVPPLPVYFEAIRREVRALSLPLMCELWCEPGAGLVGTAGEHAVRVELRKGDALYLNDGNFGGLRDLCYEKRRNEVRRVRPGVKAVGEVPLKAFRFYGPTCESMDYMPGPFMLPDDIAEGDWIVVRSLGSYCQGFRAKYNGFYSDLKVEIKKARTANLFRLKTPSKDGETSSKGARV